MPPTYKTREWFESMVYESSPSGWMQMLRDRVEVIFNETRYYGA